MSNTDDTIDIIALAAQAKAIGYGTPERITEYLELIIKRNVAYLNRPYRQFRSGGYNADVEKDNKVIAAAIVLIESTASQ